jgi:uracil-DNA glycosylase
MHAMVNSTNCNLIKPNIIVLAGSTAVGSYLGIKEPISQLRGRVDYKRRYKVHANFSSVLLTKKPLQ